jgi:hypothetical protein
MWFLPNLVEVWICSLGAIFGGVPPDLVDPPNLLFFLEFRSRAIIGHFPTAMWQPMTGPCGSQPLGHVNQLYNHLPRQCTVFHLSYHIILPHHSMVYRVAVQTVTWHIFTGPRNDLKVPKMGDTWQPLVLPCHHDDVNMTCVTSCMCHVCCTDADIIRTDANINNTDADWARLTKL